ALEALSDGRPKAAGWYLNLATWRRYAELWSGWHPHPTTMPTNVVEAFDVALTGLLEEGVERRWTRLARARDRVREGLEEVGFGMLSPIATASPVTTAVYGLPGLDVVEEARRRQAVDDAMVERHGEVHDRANPDRVTHHHRAPADRFRAQDRCLRLVDDGLPRDRAERAGVVQGERAFPHVLWPERLVARLRCGVVDRWREGVEDY